MAKELPRWKRGPEAENSEAIDLVEHSILPAKRPLEELQAPRNRNGMLAHPVSGWS